jgi:hypothetical protein
VLPFRQIVSDSPPPSLTFFVSTMGTADVYGFVHEDLEGARRAIENALSINLEEAQESMPPNGSYFRSSVGSGPWVQIRRNSGPHLRWQGDRSHPWYPEYRLLVWVWGPGTESVAERLKREVPGLLFLETQSTM